MRCQNSRPGLSAGNFREHQRMKAEPRTGITCEPQATPPSPEPTRGPQKKKNRMKFLSIQNPQSPPPPQSDPEGNRDGPRHKIRPRPVRRQEPAAREERHPDQDAEPKSGERTQKIERSIEKLHSPPTHNSSDPSNNCGRRSTTKFIANTDHAGESPPAKKRRGAERGNQRSKTPGLPLPLSLESLMKPPRWFPSDGSDGD